MKSRNERQSRVFHYVNKGKLYKHYQGEVKKSLMIFRVKDPGRQKQSRILSYASPVENIKNYKNLTQSTCK